MKSILAITLAAGLLLLSGESSGQSVTIDHVDGLYGVSSSEIVADGLTPITFYIRITGDASAHGGIINGFRVYSDDGATWGTTTGDTLGLGKAQFDGFFFINYFGVTGSGADTVGFGAFSFFGTGLPAGFDDIAYSIEIGPIDASNHNKTICLDSSYYPPSGVWIWAGPNVAPSWSGVRCFTCINPIATGVDERYMGELPQAYSLSQNYPNPFNPETKIGYTITTRSYVTITIRNILGQQINSLVNEEKGVGEHHVFWNGTDEAGNKVASGVYFYQLHAGEYTETKKMILMK